VFGHNPWEGALVREGPSDGPIPPPEGEERGTAPSGADARDLITRRTFLRYTGVTAVAAGVGPARALAAADTAFGRAGGSGLVVDVVRARDMLAVSFEFLNLKLLRRGQPGPGNVQSARLTRIAPTRPALVVVHFDPQHLAEHAFFEVNDPKIQGDPGAETLTSPPVPSSMAGPSRLGFVVPDGMKVIPFDLGTLLGWSEWIPNLTGVAQEPAPQGAGIQEPGVSQTALEVPWRLILSPGPAQAWLHPVAAVTHRDPKDGVSRTELWHTRLGTHLSNPRPHTTEGGKLRAVWTPGFNPSVLPNPNDLGPDPPERTSLKPNDRWQIVRLTSDRSLFLQGTSTKYTPTPVNASRFALSALGVWMDSVGTWPTVQTSPFGFQWVSDLVEWDHRAAIGRDNFVRVIHAGHLFPFGHRAVVITVTERKLQPAEQGPAAGQVGAYLRQHAFIVVREPTRSYPANGAQPFGARDLPFTKVTLKSLVTPNLEPYDGQNSVPATRVLRPNSTPYGSFAFWPMIPSSSGTPVDFAFQIEAVDRDGQTIHFGAPMIFVSATLSLDAGKKSDIDRVAQQHQTATPASRHTIAMSGQKVAFAKFAGGSAGDTAHETQDMTFGGVAAKQGDSIPSGQPRFFPRMVASQVRLQAAEQIAGSALAKRPTISFHSTYLNGGANHANVFASLIRDSEKFDDNPTVEPLDLILGADRSGGAITPSMAITGLSSLLGPMGGDLQSGVPSNFDPQDFFGTPGTLPKILGGIDLWDIIAAVTGFSDLAKVPKTLSSPLPDRIVTSLEWDPEPQGDPLDVFRPGASCSISLKAEITTMLDPNGSPGESTFSIEGTIEDFQVALIGNVFEAIVITFDHLTFTSRSGEKPDVDPAVTDMEFVGVLEFVSKLQEFLQSVGLGSGGLTPSRHAKALPKGGTPDEPDDDGGGPSIQVDADGITASVSVSLPAIQVGVFSLEGISFGASLTIPFVDGPARIRFNFASEDHPFLITVSLFGGGGSVAVGLGLDGFESLTLSLEFGAKLAIDLGVASGDVSVMAGVYINIEEQNNGLQKTVLTGFVKIEGNLDVLGLISAHLLFDLELTYEDDGTEKSVWGQAQLTVEVDVLCFSASVTVGPIEKRFAGGGGGGGSIAARSGAAAPDDAGNDNHVSFADLMSSTDWAAYAGAYAPAAFA
jgi:hypothetical protein